MIRTSLLAAATTLCFAPVAIADHDGYHSMGTYHSSGHSVASSQCERQKDNDRLAGGVVGAVAGGLIGAAIGGELEPDNGYHRYRGYRGYGHRRGGYYHDRGDDGAEIAGAVIGGLIGAAIGSEVAADSTDCTPTYNYGYQGQTYSHQGRSDFGEAYAPTRSPTGPAWETPQTRPVSAAAPAYPSTPAYPSVPAYPTDEDYDLAGAPENSVNAGECTTVRRETRLPDGTIIREPVEVCQTEDGRWQMPQVIPES